MKLMNRIRCYDNGGVSVDRFTVLFLSTNRMVDKHTIEYDCLSMSIYPRNPQGVCMHGQAREPNPALGRRIEFSDLPVDCQLQVMEELS